jgi:hypothetical protein
MKPDCRNDCQALVAFPRAIRNRPGLPRIGYRIGTYSDFREALFHALDLDPVLSPFTYRGADDPAIALLEGAAILGDILTFYQETYANELYLQTATLPASVASLVRLVGYRLSPGVGGRATFAFEVSGDTPVVIPAGFPLTADVTGLPDPADFETAAEITARPALSRFSLYRPFTVPAIAPGTTRFAVATAELGGGTLAKGDRLMLVAGAYHQVTVIDVAEPRFEQTEVTIKGSWWGPAAATVVAYKLGREFGHFGASAPPTVTEVKNDKAEQTAVDFDRWIGPSLLFVASGPATGLAAATITLEASGPGYVATGLPPGLLALDSQVDDLSPGTTLLVAFDRQGRIGKNTPGLLAVRQVKSVRNTSLTHGAMTGPSTVVELDALLGSVPGDTSDIRTVRIHEVAAGPLTLGGVRTPLGAGPTSPLFFFGSGADYEALAGRPLQLERVKPAPGEKEAVEQVTAAVSPAAIGDPVVMTLRPLTLQPAPRLFALDEFPLSFPKDDPPVVAYGNLAPATQGKRERQTVLGNGDARAAFQTFAVPKAPLTYLVSSSETPPEVPELQVTVEGLAWTRVASLVGRGPKDQVYVVREGPDGQSYVQFGDGETGARLPSGVGNVTCTYRTGGGAYGPLKPGASADAGATVAGLDAVALVAGATGGAAPEEPEKARVAAPGRIQSLGRLVSLRDFETETLLIPGVSAASAAWEPVDGVPAVVVTVLMETGRAAEMGAVTELLGTYNVCRGPQRYAIVVRPAERTYLYVDAAVAFGASRRQEVVFEEVRAALAGLFSVPKRRFGEPEYRSRIEGTIQSVSGVLWATLAGLGSLGPADDPGTLALPAPPRPLSSVVACGPRQLLALLPAHVSLSAVAAPVKVCE